MGCMRVAGWRVQDVKHHPASVDLELIKRLLATTRCKTLQQFLAREFSSISKEYAGGRRCLPPHWAPGPAAASPARRHLFHMMP